MKYGLEESIIEQIHSIFTLFPTVDKVVLYGSRAKGTYKTGSDIDLCLFGTDLPLPLLYKIEEALDNLLLPYSFDLSSYNNLTNEQLIAHINRVGILFYEKTLPF